MKSPEDHSTLVAVLAFFLCGVVLIVLNLSVQDTAKYTHPEVDLQRVLIECGVSVALLICIYLIWRAHEDRKQQAKEGTAGRATYKLRPANVLDPLQHPGSSVTAAPVPHVAIDISPLSMFSSVPVPPKPRTRRS